MFEKEAEERARKLEENQTLGIYDNEEDYARDSGWNDGEVAGYEEGFIDGAEFGYNKCKDKVETAIEIIEQMKDLFFACWQERGYKAIKFEQNVNDFLKENK